MPRLGPGPVAALGLLSVAAPETRVPVSIPYDDARTAVESLREALPAGLAGLTADRLAAAWPGWVAERNRAVRDRLVRGEADAVVNLLFFGTSFTTAPPLAAQALDRVATAEVETVFSRRLADLTTAIAGSGGDERLRFARSVFARGRPGAAAAERAAVESWLVDAVRRVRAEQAAFAAELARVHALPDSTSQFAARSTLFRDRGIALDTSLRAAFAVDEALRDALDRGLLTTGSVRRVAVVGPGLDFMDKAEGQDFYPPQSMQALALADSLVRFGLSRPESLSIAAFDISPRVLDHLERVREQARAGEGYVLQLPRPRDGWAVPFVAYWQRLGDAVADPAVALKPLPSAGPLEVRAVRVRPPIVASVRPIDLNVVYQRLDLAPAERFDLVVATNVLVYYDTFEQCLALANVARMTAIGGLFLANNSVLELPGSTLRSVGYTTVVFSGAPDDGEHVVFYRRLPDARGR